MGYRLLPKLVTLKLNNASYVQVRRNLFSLLDSTVSSRKKREICVCRLLQRGSVTSL